MLSPKEAFERLCQSGPFDDPWHSWYPVRWYFNDKGILCSCPWRGCPTSYPEFTRPVKKEV